MTTTRQAGEAALFVSASCEGETCMCGQPAVRKIGEEIPRDDPLPHRHNLTAYVCAEHYAMLLGPRAARSVGVDWKALASDLEQVIRERDEAVRHLRAMSHVCPKPGEVEAALAFLSTMEANTEEVGK